MSKDSGISPFPTGRRAQKEDKLRMNLLVVDSDRSLAVIAADVAKNWGHNAEISTSAEEALRRAGQNNLDVVLIDVSNTDRHWLEVIKDLKKIQPKVGIVAMNGEDYYYPELESELRKQGILYYTIKPIGSKSLLTTVLDHLFLRLGALSREKD